MRFPPSAAHRWFARRFSSAFRAILTAARLKKSENFWDAFYDGVDYTGGDSVDGRFYIVGKDSIGGSISVGYGGTPTSTFIYSDALENFSTPVTGDNAVTLAERELNGSTPTHVGFYAVNNLSIVKDAAGQTVNMPTLRAIPVPYVTQPNGDVQIDWIPAVDDGSGNIVGYKVVRGTDGSSFPTEVGTVDASTTSMTDSSIAVGTTYYYALKILFRGTATTPEVESFMSANSNALTVGNADLLMCIPSTGEQGDTGLELEIIGDNTSFDGTSTVQFTGLNGITISMAPYDISATSLKIQIDIAGGAVLGPRNIVVTTTTPNPDEVAVGNNIFWVIPPGPYTYNLILDPDEGVQGATFDVDVSGGAGYFVQGLTTAFFGPDITVNSVTVTSPTTATANITIDPDATIGTTDVFFFTGGDYDVGQFTILERDIPPDVVPNYPNPFDPNNDEETRIVIEPKQNGVVGVYVYDITARLVFRHTQYMTAGSYNEVIWNGDTYYNEIADNGVYLVRVIDEGSRKMIGKGKIMVIKHQRRP